MSEEKRLAPTLRFPEFREASAWPLKRLGDFLTEIDLAATHAELVQIEKEIAAAKQKHNAFLIELGLSPLP